MNQHQDDLPGGTVTFLFTDIQGSTQLLQRLAPRRLGVIQRVEHSPGGHVTWKYRSMNGTPDNKR